MQGDGQRGGIDFAGLAGFELSDSVAQGTRRGSEDTETTVLQALSVERKPAWARVSAHGLRCGDAANQVFLLGLAFGSDRKGVEQAKGQGVLDGFILAIA